MKSLSGRAGCGTRRGGGGADYRARRGKANQGGQVVALGGGGQIIGPEGEKLIREGRLWDSEGQTVGSGCGTRRGRLWGQVVGLGGADCGVRL